MSVYEDEWLPELIYILKGDEARPITRLVHGTRYALGILARTRSITRHLHQPVPGQRQALASQPSLQRVQHLSWMLYDARTAGKPVSAFLREQTITQLSEDISALLEDHVGGVALRKFYGNHHRIVKCLLAELRDGGYLLEDARPWYRRIGDLLYPRQAARR